MRVLLFALLLPACSPRDSGCGGDRGASTTFCGVFMDQFFPFDARRTWTFQNDDATIPYHVIATLDPEFSTIEGGAVEVHTIHYAIDCLVEGECFDGDPFRVRSIQPKSRRAAGPPALGLSAGLAAPGPAPGPAPDSARPLTFANPSRPARS